MSPDHSHLNSHLSNTPNLFDASTVASYVCLSPGPASAVPADAAHRHPHITSTPHYVRYSLIDHSALTLNTVLKLTAENQFV